MNALRRNPPPGIRGARLDAFADPVVAVARRVELAAVGVVIVLMVLKPF